jgi:hypothetical protein
MMKQIYIERRFAIALAVRRKVWDGWMKMGPTTSGRWADVRMKEREMDYDEKRVRADKNKER